METESTSHRLSTMFVVAIMLLAPMLILVTISPVASAAVTTGATVDMIPASSRYIRDDSTAVPIWGFGATSSTGLDRLWEVNVWFDMTGTGLTTGDIEGLSTAGSSSGVGLYRDTGGTDDAFDSTDLPITVTSIQWFWSFGDYYCRMRLNGILEWVPTAAALQGSYQWFIVVRTDSNIEASDLVRTWLNAGDIDYTDGSSQPSSGVTGSTLDVRASSYDFVGSGGISTSDAEAALGIRICDGGPYDTFDYIRIQFQNGGGFTQTDLATLGLNPATSGVALYRNDGTSSSSWDASDTGLTLSSMSISWPFVYLYPNSEALPDRPRSGYDYWIVVRTSATISDGNTFTVIGDTSTIIVDGLSAGADQNTATPESGYDDYGTFVCDNVAPGISSMVWTEWSSYLHTIGSTLYFSNLMTWTQTATLRCNAWDSSSGIWYVTFSYEGSLGSGGYTDYSSPYEYTYEIDSTDTMADTPISVTVVDRAGLSTSTTVQYVQDNVKPAVTINSPVDLDTLSGTVSISADVTDGVTGIMSNSVYASWDYQWTWNQMIWNGVQYVYDWDTTMLADGDYRLMVWGYDNVYNEGSDYVNVRIDNTGPTSQILLPVAGTYVHSGQDLYVYATATDASSITSMEAQLGAGGWGAMTYDPIYGVWWANLGVPGAGNLNVQVRATDSEGNLGPVSSIIVVGDANDPTVSVASHSAGDEVRGTITVQVQAADTEQLESVWVSFTGTTPFTLEAIFNPSTGYYEVTVDTGTLSDGSWSIVATANDEAGRMTTTAAFSITVDNTEPTLAIVSPTSGTFVWGTYTVTATATDSGSGFDVGGVAMSVDGGAWVALTLSGSYWSADIDTTSLSDGAHTIVVAAMDDAGNVAVRMVTIYVDNTQPTVSVVAPATSDYVEGVYTFAVSAVDNMGITNVSCSIVGPSATIDVAFGFNAASGYYEWTADTTAWADGQYTIKPFATELSGRAFVNAASIGFLVDNNAPVVSVTAPRDGVVILSNSYTVTISASDGAFTLLTSQVMFRVDAGPWTSMTAGTGASWSHVWDTTGVVDGTHVLSFRVTDTAGHVTNDAVTVSVDNTDPSCMVAVPSAGQYLEGSVTFAIKATDALGVSNVDISFTGVQGLGTVAATFNPSTGYWEFVLDTSTLTDTDGSVAARATDSSGRTASASAVSFRIDNNAPTLVIDEPMDGEVILTDTYDVTIQADDVSFGLSPGDVEWRVDSNPWADMQAGATGWTVNWATTDYADGNHVLHFRVTDEAGHVTEGSVTVTVDNNDPTVSLNTPSIGEYVEGVYTFSARAADSLGVDTVEMSFGFSDPSPLTSAMATYDPSSGYWELTVDSATLPDGAATIVLVATDTSGRMTTSAIHDFSVDNNAPDLKLESPLPGDIVLDGTLAVLIEASDEGFILGPGDVEYSLDGTGWVDMVNLTAEPTLWGFEWNATSVADGEHNLAFRVTDSAGHVTSADVTFVVDNNDPTCQIISPATGEFAEDVYHFRVAANDALGVQGVTLTFEGVDTLATAAANYNPASGLWEFLIDTTTLDDAAATVSAEASDSSGRTSTLAGPVDFTIDNHAPVVAFLSPTEGMVIIEGNHTVVASAIDETFPVEAGSVHLSIDMGAWVALIAVDGDFEFVWDTSGLSDGEHNLRVQAEDLAGHISETAINVIVDNHDPDVAVVAPTAGQYVTGPLNFQVAASDARDIVEVTLDWGVGEPVTATVNAATNYYEYSLDTTTLADDTYELTATALDCSGRTTQVSVTFQVDNHEPVLTFDGPLTGEILDGEVTVYAGVDDVFVDSLQFSVDGVGWVDMVDGEGTFDSTRFADGLHTIMVRAVDGSGKVTSASSEVTIDNTAPIISVADFPSLDAHVAGDLDFGLFGDDAVGVESVTVATGDDTWNVYLNPATGFYEWTMDTTMFEDGFHDLVFTAFDEAGHDSSLAWSVYVDNTAPLVTSTKPKEGDTVEGTVKFEWVLIDDTAVDWVRIRIGRGVWQEMTDQENGIYVYEWETTSSDDVEDLDITVRYADTLGNIEDAEMQVTVDNPVNWTVVGIFIGLILLIVFMIFFMRRRMGDNEEAEGGETSYGEGDLEEISVDKDLDELLNPDGNPNGSQSQMERPPIDADSLASEVEVELEEKRRK